MNKTIKKQRKGKNGKNIIRKKLQSQKDRRRESFNMCKKEKKMTNKIFNLITHKHTHTQSISDFNYSQKGEPVMLLKSCKFKLKLNTIRTEHKIEEFYT